MLLRFMYLWRRFSDTQASIIPLITQGNAFSGTIRMPKSAMLVNTYNYNNATATKPHGVHSSILWLCEPVPSLGRAAAVRSIQHKILGKVIAGLIPHSPPCSYCSQLLVTLWEATVGGTSIQPSPSQSTEWKVINEKWIPLVTAPIYVWKQKMRENDPAAEHQGATSWISCSGGYASRVRTWNADILSRKVKKTADVPITRNSCGVCAWDKMEMCKLKGYLELVIKKIFRQPSNIWHQLRSLLHSPGHQQIPEFSSHHHL